MKKFIAMLLLLAVCCGLCACGFGIGKAEEIVLPTAPEQIAKPTQPVRESQNGTDTTAESTEAYESIGETYPWEAAFNEAEYSRMEGIIDNVADIIVWKENGFSSPTVRQLEYRYDGNIVDNYYYPSGTFSHTYQYNADGSYIEAHYLDNGRIEIEGNNSHVFSGTNIYYKQIQPDGSYQESVKDENGNLVYHIQQSANGDYLEIRYYKNGNCSVYVCNEPTAGYYTEQESYEDGSTKRIKQTSPGSTCEEYLDEDGFRTYFYNKTADYEIELTADETGKLVKVVENGVTIEDTAIIAQYAQSFNFKE